jgi:hypothetical protein
MAMLAVGIAKCAPEPFINIWLRFNVYFFFGCHIPHHKQ